MLKNKFLSLIIISGLVSVNLYAKEIQEFSVGIDSKSIPDCPKEKLISSNIISESITSFKTLKRTQEFEDKEIESITEVIPVEKVQNKTFESYICNENGFYKIHIKIIKENK